MTGLDAITVKLEQLLTGLISFHERTVLDVHISGPGQATSINYLQTNFFGTGNATGKAVSAYGYYKNDLVKTPESDAWRVQNRELHTVIRSLETSSVYSL